MKVVVCENYDDLSNKAFEVIKEQVVEKPNSVLGLATGSSPVGMYQDMIKDHKENGTSYKDVSTYNLDEYVGIDRNDPQSYYTFMNENLFSGIDIDPNNTHVPYGNTKKIAKSMKTRSMASISKFLESGKMVISASMSQTATSRLQHTA